MVESDHRVTFLKSQGTPIRNSSLETILTNSARSRAPHSSSLGMVLDFKGATLDLEQYS